MYLRINQYVSFYIADTFLRQSLFNHIEWNIVLSLFEYFFVSGFMQNRLKMLCSQRSFNGCKNIRLFANAALKENAKDENSRCHDNESKVKNIPQSTIVGDVKNYEKIPGPKGFLGIGTFYHYFPIVGMQMSGLNQPQICK